MRSQSIAADDVVIFRKRENESRYSEKFSNFVVVTEKLRTKYIDIHTHNPRVDVLSPTMAGIHPWLAESTVELPDFSQCDIIGETGLDYACEVDREAQKRLFREHLDAAIKTNKPVVLHVVRAVDDVLNILKEHSGLRGIVFHGFIGSLQQAERCIERGYYLSVGPRSLRSPKVREVIAKIPQNLLFCETDAEQDKGNIEQVYSEVAELRGIGVEELIKSIEENYNRIFRND